MPNLNSAIENAAALRKAFGRPKDANRVVKSRAVTRVHKNGRPALVDKTNRQEYSSDSEDFAGPKKRLGPQVGALSEDELETTTEIELLAPQSKQKTFNMSNHSKAVPANGHRRHERTREETAEEIPETQVPQPMDLDEDEIASVHEPQPARASRYGSHDNTRQFSNSTRRAAAAPTYNSRVVKRAGSASDTERNDPTTRRRLADMTRKLESVEARYNELRDVGIREAELNFDAFKNQSEAKNKAAEEYINSLKADLINQNAMMKEGRALKRQCDAQSAELANLKSQVAQLTKSLTEAQSENKTLATKLAATRAASIENANAKSTSGFPAMVNGVPRLMGSAEAAQAAQIAQLKEELYSDLTGLLVRAIKKEAEEDVYDCIQTGRNGTLHFKLAIGHESSSSNYDETQCSYSPQLDPSRDKALMEMLPDYLQEDISFTRPQCAKFYVRVVKALNDRLV